MRVLRGRASDPETDREWTASMLEAAADGTSRARVWRPPRQIAFGRRDVHEPGFEQAKRLAAAHGFRPIQRDVGGRAVVYTGQTLAFAHAVPLANDHRSIAERYERTTAIVLSSLRRLGAAVSAGEPPAAFCPGDHSVRVTDGGKIAGLAQRVRANSALIAGCLVVVTDDAHAIAEVTDQVYDALGVSFDPSTVGSVAAAGGPDDLREVAHALERGFIHGSLEAHKQTSRTERLRTESASIRREW